MAARGTRCDIGHSIRLTIVRERTGRSDAHVPVVRQPPERVVIVHKLVVVTYKVRSPRSPHTPHRFQSHSSRIIWATRSASMKTGTFVLLLVMNGNTDASTTRSRSTPFTRHSGSTTP